MHLKKEIVENWEERETNRKIYISHEMLREN